MPDVIVERAPHVWVPVKNVDELAVPVARRAVGTVPELTSLAFKFPTNDVALTTFAKAAFWLVLNVTTVAFDDWNAKLPVLSVVDITAVVNAFIVDGISCYYQTDCGATGNVASGVGLIAICLKVDL